MWHDLYLWYHEPCIHKQSMITDIQNEKNIIFCYIREMQLKVRQYIDPHLKCSFLKFERSLQYYYQ
jgi:hypothetical protein